VPLIADGGIKRHGALALALMFGGDCVMLGSAFAGHRRDARRRRPQVGAAAGIAEDR
jgi:IMP dehydrogenase/GMP reductase